ncbi:MAG: hypothetical protein M9891_00545 [Austwickia sp.]|nr:antitoxin [Actinomycetota bacterium]MCB1254033.1 hypothetical protein [Austwickia sp.]MCO5307778.1 hypothetical protein [Austwickia sp.]
MCISLLERRLQILLDGARYERLAREAEATGHSVAAIVREAIDLRLPPDLDKRAEAGRRLLELADRTGQRPEPDWAEIKADIEADIEARLP